MPSLSDVNWIAIAVAVVVNMVIGAVWYSNVLFAKEWTALVGKTEAELKGGAATGYAIAVVLGLIEAVFLSFLVTKLGAATALDGALVGLMVWVGFILPATAVTAVFSGTRKKLWAINYGYHLVTFTVIGAILAAWPK